MFKILPYITKATRTMSSTVWKINYFHTSNIFYTDKPKKPNPKTKQVKKEKKTPALCSILEGEDNKNIKKQLKLKLKRLGNEEPSDILVDSEELTDILVGHILANDIKVYKVALENNVTVFRGRLGHLGNLPKNLPKEIKVGRYSAAEDEVITINWNKLLEEVKLKDYEEFVVKELFENISMKKDLGLKRNVLGYYLSQGLAQVRLATDVYQRVRTIHCATKGEFTKEEDKIILEGRKGKKSFSALAEQLRRTCHRTVRDRHDMLISDFEYKHGPFTVKEDELILREVFAVNKNILVDRNIAVENWKNIGEKLQRKYKYVHERWTTKLEPMLKRYHAGTLNDNVREVLINHLVKNNLNYTQEVDWKGLAKLPKFAGTTPTYLNKMYATLRSSTSKKYPELSEVKLDTGAIQMFLDNREEVNSATKEYLEHQEMVITYYLTYI